MQTISSNVVKQSKTQTTGLSRAIFPACQGPEMSFLIAHELKLLIAIQNQVPAEYNT
jgi:hypothetical protein